jgi:hypothetical protein
MAFEVAGATRGATKRGNCRGCPPGRLAFAIRTRCCCCFSWMREGRISCACVVLLLLLLFLIQQRRPAQWRWKSSPIWWRGANYAIGRASRSRRLPPAPARSGQRESERAQQSALFAAPRLPRLQPWAHYVYFFPFVR